MNVQSIVENLGWIDKIAGLVWVVLSGILIYVLYRIYMDEGGQSRNFIAGIFLLIFIWLYPLYTGFFTSLVLGEIGNILTLIFTVTFFMWLKRDQPSLSSWMIPQMIWLTAATMYVGLQLINRT